LQVQTVSSETVPLVPIMVMMEQKEFNDSKSDCEPVVELAYPLCLNPKRGELAQKLPFFLFSRLPFLLPVFQSRGI
jgi:hypothetical protein